MYLFRDPPDYWLCLRQATCQIRTLLEEKEVLLVDQLRSFALDWDRKPVLPMQMLIAAARGGCNRHQ